MSDKIVKTEEQWRRELTPEQYEVCRRKGTEAPFTGAYYSVKRKGVYACACCGNPLFDSNTKFDSGTGWPSFWAPVDASHVDTEIDLSHGMRRTEVTCSRCGAHLGHVFEDGPAPASQRYCINSVALDLRCNDDQANDD
ncbi:MAG: peptide-methionine (R)-S-oxide reductase MsrB [Gammaproteobacteria bacterium]